MEEIHGRPLSGASGGGLLAQAAFAWNRLPLVPCQLVSAAIWGLWQAHPSPVLFLTEVIAEIVINLIQGGKSILPDISQ